MIQGHFTKNGHYVVLYGVETINGMDYFKILDPNGLNEQYGNDGMIIKESRGYVLADCSIFPFECEEYWVYSEE